MSESEISPISSRERIEILDVLRGLAVGGILIGNMQWFSGYGMMPEALAAQAPLADRITQFLVHFLVEGKFYSIFSFLFGFGFALQIQRAGAARRPDRLAFQTALVLAAGHRSGSHLFAVVWRYFERLCLDGLGAHFVSPQNKRRAAQMGAGAHADSDSDLYSALYFVCRLCPARSSRRIERRAA